VRRRALVACAVAALAGCAGGDADQVGVPGIRSAGFRFAYDRLHAAGLRVSVPGGLRTESLCTPI
jgi:hypothetical protein